MTALGPGELRARRRPSLIAAITVLRILAAFCLAWPLSALVGASGVSLRAEGDRALFEGGGYLLLELVRLHGSELSAAARGLLPVLCLGLLLTAACNAALLVGINHRERLSVGNWTARALDRLPALVVLGAGTALGQLALIGAGAAGAGAVPDLLANPVLTTVGQGAVWLVTAVAVGALGGLSDVAKASLVRHDSRLSDGLRLALKCFRHRPIRATFGWFPYALAFLGSAAIATWLSQLCDVSRDGAWRVAAVFLVHQLVVVVSVVARAGWFARALRLVAIDV